jgi:MacB-like periplasmic core domain/FtsX-like permease family
MRSALRVAWYRFRTTLIRRWGGYVTLIVLMGLVGGLAMGSIAAARRTQSSFPGYMASTRPSDLEGVTGLFTPGGGPFSAGYNPSILHTVAGLPHVASLASVVGLNTLFLGPSGAPVNPPSLPAQAGEGIGLVGPGLDQDQVTVLDGRLPSGTHDVVMSRHTASLFGVHLGDHLRFGVYTNDQTYLPGFGTSAVRPHAVLDTRLVGIVVSNSQVIEDDADVAGNANIMAFPPAATVPLLGCCAYFTQTGVRVDDGSHHDSAVLAEIGRSLHNGLVQFQVGSASGIVAKAERAIKPESIALGVFGLICGLAALLIGAQLIGRQLRLLTDDLAVERALGADRGMTTSDGLVGMGGSVLAGTVLAVAVAVALSPLAPLGPARAVDPTPGVAFDWTVLGLGVAVLVAVLGAVALVVGLRLAPGRSGIGRPNVTPGQQRSVVAGMAARSGLPESAVTGIRFALEPGVGRNTVPVRSAILGAALAVMVVIGTVTFGASLNTLVSHPALYGWNWDYALTGVNGSNIPRAHAAALLERAAPVVAWSGVYYFGVRLDGTDVPVIAAAPGASVTPPLLSGHPVESDDQLVLGGSTLAQLHKRVGDTVTFDNGVDPRRTLRIVGTATMPTINNGGSNHTEIGTGALLSDHLFSGRLLNTTGVPPSQEGPNAILVRVRGGTGSVSARQALERIAKATSTPLDNGITVVSVQRPAEIVNYRSMGSTPAILGIGLAVGVIAALSLTLVASVRRRRRDLALMKTLGFTHRQLAAAVAWQSTVAVAIGTLVGVPLGIIIGRQLWVLFAHEIDVVPTPTVPAATVILIALGALVLANLVAAIPARIAARTPTGLLLRAE